MGRVNRLVERRALRRAADQALLMSLGSMAQSHAVGAADQDFTYTHDECERPQPVQTAARDDYEPTTEPIPVLPETEHARIPPPDDYHWQERDEPSPPPIPVQPPVRARLFAETAYVRPDLDFAIADVPRPWYRTKPAAAAVVAAVITAVVFGGWLFLWSPSTAAEQSSTEAPTSTPPTPSKAQPTAVSAPQLSPVLPAPPPSPPPPPPPAARTYSPAQRQYSPRYSEPTEAQKPRVDVTRAPMSVAPVPKPVPGSDSNTPGDTPNRDSGRRRRGCFGFC
jgi:hypothetical protein